MFLLSPDMLKGMPKVWMDSTILHYSNQNICVKFKIAAFEKKIIQKFKLDNEWLFFCEVWKKNVQTQFVKVLCKKVDFQEVLNVHCTSA